MKQKEFDFQLNGINYKVNITLKPQRNIYYRFRDGSFYVSAPYFTSEYIIKKGLLKFGPNLIKKTNAARKAEHYSIRNGTIYILGVQKELAPYGCSKTSDSFEYFDEEDLRKKIKKLSLEYITSRVKYFEKIMKTKKEHKVHVKSMKTRYGSNSSMTNSLSFLVDLYHYSPEIIDSVVIHELAHDFYRDHKPHFYKVVLQYCPNYWELKHKLNKRIHS